MIGRLNCEPPQELLDNRSDPDARAVLADWRLSNGEKVSRLGVALWMFYGADADADAATAATAATAAATAATAADAADATIAAADADADAAAAAAATIDAAAIRNLSQSLHGDLDMKDGLKIIKLPSGYYGVTMIAWVRRVAGDEYTILPGARVVWRTRGNRFLNELADDGPKQDHEMTPPMKGVDGVGEEGNWLKTMRSIPANEKAWAEWCPKPKGWVAK